MTMNTQRMAAAIREIDKLTLALNWLREYGDSLVAKDRTSFRVHIEIVSASACVGATEARNQMEAIARLYIKDIVDRAKLDAENTIEIHTAAIREEAQ